MVRKLMIALSVMAVFLFSSQGFAAELTLPDQVKVIQEEAFAGDTSLYEVALPEGITTIESRAFAYSSLARINLPSSLTSIAEDAFEGIDELLVEAPEGSYAYEWALEKQFIWHSASLEDFTFGTIDDLTCQITAYHGDGGKVVIPDVDGDGRTVTGIGANAFYDCDAIEQVNIPANIKSIGANAFAACDGITSIILHEGLESIGERAFADCVSLLSLKVPDSVTSIEKNFILGDLAMTSLEFGGGVRELYVQITHLSTREEDVPALETLIIGEGVEKLGDYVYARSDYTYFGDDPYNCNYPNLKNITLPESLTVIGEGAFRRATSLESITLPSKLETIGHLAFDCCSALQSINIPDTVTTIGNYAFSCCGALEDIVLPDGLESIGNYAFYDCNTFTYIDIPASVESIGSFAFWHCDSITTIMLNEGLKSIGESAFAGCASLLGLILPDSVINIEKNFILGDLAMVYLEFGGGVKELYVWITHLSTWAEANPALETLVIREGVETLGDYAFARSNLSYFNDDMYNCYYPNLRNITLPQSLKTLGEGVFFKASSLQTIDISMAKTLGNGIFCECENLTSVVLPAGIKGIPDYTFYKCSKLVNVNIPATVERIGVCAFYECSQLPSVDFTAMPNLWKIGDSAFCNCDRQTTVNLNAIQIIGVDAFKDCDSLSSVYLSDSSTKEIGAGAFSRCPLLQELTIPSSVVYVGRDLIVGDAGLKSLTINGGLSVNSGQYHIDAEGCEISTLHIGGNVTSIGYGAFAGWATLTNVTLPSYLTVIESWAFSGCSNVMGNLSLPTGLNYLGRGAFQDCPNWVGYGIVIPYNVTYLSGYTFAGCSRLSTIVLSSKVEGVDTSAFAACAESVELLVPAGSTIHQWCVDNYREGYSWTYRTYADDSVYYNTSVHYATAAPRNVSVYSETYRENEPYRISFAIDDDIQAVNLYVMRNSAAMTLMKTFYTTSEGVTVSESEGVYDWTIDFAPTEAGVIGDNYDVRFRLETVDWIQRNTGICTDTGYVKIIPAEIIEPVVELLVDDAELISYKATKVNLTLKVSQSDSVDETNSLSPGYLENPYILLELPEGITSCVFSEVMGGYRLETDEDGNYKLYMTSVNGAYGTATVACEFRYDVVSDVYGGYNNETIVLTVKADGGYENGPCESNIVFGIDLLELTENEIKTLYYKQLRKNGSSANPLDDAKLSAILYYELTGWFDEKLEDEKCAELAERMLDCLNHAPSYYRSLYLYSFYLYDKSPEPFVNGKTQSSCYVEADNTIYLDSSLYSSENDSFIATIFHETGHAIDCLAGTGGHMTKSDDTLKQFLLNDCRDWLGARIPNIFLTISEEETHAIIEAALDPKNGFTEYKYLEDLEDSYFIVGGNPDIESAYEDDYKKFIVRCCEFLVRDYGAIDYNSRSIVDINMYADIISGITNYAVRIDNEKYMHKIESHKNYWYTAFFHQWTGQQGMEAWAEFYASQMLSSDYGDALSTNKRVFPQTCTYFEKWIAPQMRNQIRNKAP